MPSERETLLAAIDELRRQIEFAEGLDSQTIARLESDLQSASAALANPPPKEPTSAVNRSLRDAVIDFEASHPALATAIGNVVDALGRVGI
jgi:hypothetical protein